MLLDNLTPLTAELVRPAAMAAARAFADDPTTLYLIPGTGKRANLHYAFEYYLRLSLLCREKAYVTSTKCEGVAVWLHSEEHISFINTLRAGWPGLPLRCGLRYLIRDAAMERRYDELRQKLAPKPHLYLALLAIDPACQGQGFASALVRPMLQRLDETRLPAYLETQNLKNVAMYRRFGFNLLQEDTMPSAGLTMYLMARPSPA